MSQPSVQPQMHLLVLPTVLIYMQSMASLSYDMVMVHVPHDTRFASALVL